MPVTQLTATYTKAVDYARVLHASDVRKGTEIPYLAHVIAVSSIVLENGGTEDQAIAALLHDAGEDHGGHARIAEIRAEFGDTVADIVAACSDDLPADRAAKRPWLVRKTEYIDRLRVEPEEMVLVSAADKLHNARAILTDHRHLEAELWCRFNKDAGRSGSLWYYRSLAAVIETRLRKRAPILVDELHATVEAVIASVVEHEGVSAADVEAEIEEVDRRSREMSEVGAPTIQNDPNSY
jgi:(p)ppGpp synthase/HD superfamily hydrolase